MELDNYTRREHDILFNDIKETLGRIEIQTTATNGRVKELELERARQAGFYKALSIGSGLAWTIAMGLSGWTFTQLTTLDSRITKSVQDALSAYVINK